MWRDKTIVIMCGLLQLVHLLVLGTGFVQCDSYLSVREGIYSKFTVAIREGVPAKNCPQYLDNIEVRGLHQSYLRAMGQFGSRFRNFLRPWPKNFTTWPMSRVGLTQFKWFYQKIGTSLYANLDEVLRPHRSLLWLMLILISVRTNYRRNYQQFGHENSFI